MNNMFADEIDVVQQETKIKTTTLQTMVVEFEHRLRGYEWDSYGQRFVYNGNPLCQDRIIQKAITILQPFCKEVNLIGGKKFETWVQQRYECALTFNDILLTDRCPTSTRKTVVKAFRNVLQNIGDVILSSKSFMSDLFNGKKEDLGFDKKELLKV
jgi:hypothetical protein